MPIWRVAPSGTRSATNSPIRRSTSPMAGVRVARRAACPPRRRSRCRRRGRSSSPSVRGIAAVELGDDGPAAPDGRQHRLHGRAQRAEAVRVRRRDVDEHRVERQDAAPEEVRHVREEDRDVLGAALVDRRARVGADEQGAVPEVPRHLGREVRPRPLDVEVDDAHVVQLGRAGHERVEQHRRGGRGALDVDLVAGPDVGDRLGGADDLHAGSLGRVRGSPDRPEGTSRAPFGTRPDGPAGRLAGWIGRGLTRRPDAPDHCRRCRHLIRTSSSRSTPRLTWRSSRSPTGSWPSAITRTWRRGRGGSRRRRLWPRDRLGAPSEMPSRDGRPARTAWQRRRRRRGHADARGGGRERERRPAGRAIRRAPGGP